MSEQEKRGWNSQNSTTAQIEVDRFWDEFYARFPTKQDAIDEFFRRCRKAKEPCCDNQNLATEPGARWAKCANCHAVTWFSSGTFFEGIRNCAAWLAAILCFEQGVDTNPCAFARRAPCVNSTAWEIFHKLRFLVALEIEAGRLVPSEAFVSLITKRSRHTPALQHPSVELLYLRDIKDDEVEDANANANATQSPPATDPQRILQSLSIDAQKVYDVLSDEFVHSDVFGPRTDLSIGALIAALVELELAGLIDVSGNRYKKSTPSSSSNTSKQSATRPAGVAAGPSSPVPNSDSGETVAEDGRFGSVMAIIGFCRERFHGLSRKYLQLHMAGLWHLAVPERWLNGTLFRLCASSEPIRRGDLLDFVSDPDVRVPFLRA